MASRKLLHNQKGHLTTAQQESMKQTEAKEEQLQSLQQTPPDYLDELAKEEWNRIYPLLQELKVKNLDLALVCTYCTHYSNYVQATQHLNVHGMYEKTERGSKLSIYYTIQRDASDRLLSVSNKLGLNIDSRLKILSSQVEEKEDDDPFKELMKKND